MASSSKRSWKLQEFTAHNANVNCLALGHKSGRVLATGGDDKKVNLWAVGKPNCIMSLSGHATPIESVRFNNTEELVCAGSQTGALKVWDLEAAKLIKSLTGHKSGISTLDFHPYGDFIASGSHDCSIKLWDPRRKGCILTFIGHRSKVNSLKFSPDGQWIASSGEDSLIKVWDLRQGRTIQEFTNHTNSVTSVEFHPHDFLLASGGLDRTVNFWDLENFQLVSSEKDVGAVKCLWFNPDGECLFTGVTDSLKVLGWEPARLFDSIPIGWGKVFDIATAHHQLVGASFHLTNVTVYIVDTKKVQPFGGPTPEIPTSPFSPGQSIRKSFSKERPVSLRSKPKLDVKTIEESTSGTDPEEDVTADITNIKDYSEVFQPNRALIRTPPLVEPFQAPESDADPSEPQILSAPEDDYTSFTLHQLNLNENSSPPPRIRYSPPQLKKSPPRVHLSPPESLNSPPRSLHSEPEPENRIPTSTPYSRSQSNLEQVFKSRENKTHESSLITKLRNYPPTKYELQRQFSCKDVPEKLPTSNLINHHNNHINNNNTNNHNNNGIKHSASEANINSNSNFPKMTRSRKNSLSNLSSKSSATPSSSSHSNRNSSIPNLSRIPNPVPNKSEEHGFKRPELFKKPEPPKPLRQHDDYGLKRSEPVDIKAMTIDRGAGPSPKGKFSPDYDRSSFVPTPSDRPIGLDLEEFLPSNLRTAAYNNRIQDESEEEALDALAKDHNSTLALLTARAKALRLSYQHFRNSPDSKIAVERVLNMKDMAVVHDVLNVLINRQSFWSLDMCVLVLPKIHELIQSRLELHIKTGCEAVKLTLRSFSSLIRSNMLSPCSSFSVDIPREERYHKCRKCYEALMDIRMTLSGKQNIGGEIGAIFKELYADLNQLCIENHT